MTQQIAVIGGSSAYTLLQNGSFGKEGRCFTKITPFGNSAPIHQFTCNNKRFLFLSRHGEKGYTISAPFVNYRANIWALKECGIQKIISWSGPGIINKRYAIGDYVVPHDYIDETNGRANTFFEQKGIGFIRQNEPFCPEIRMVIAEAVTQIAGQCHKKGVYACTQGPRLETVAEIQKYRLSGGDMVGMTLLPEAPLTRELEICYASLCYMTNYAEGISERSYKKGELFEGMQSEEEAEQVDRSISRFPDIITTIITLLSDTQRICECKDAMLRYKKNGTINEDWKSWII